MKKHIASIVAISALGLGAATTFAIAPALADSSSADKGTKRLANFQEALKSLVADKTLTQGQADKVASTLDSALPKGGMGHRGGPGGPGGKGKQELEAAATILGMSKDELRTALHSGKSLAQIAETKNVTKATLIDKLVAAASTKIDQAVTDGKMTKAQGDERKANLKTRITEMVDRVGKPGRGDRPKDGTAPPAQNG